MTPARILASAALMALLSTASAGAAPEPGASALAVELNKLEPSGAACRVNFVVRNASASAYDELRLDLVVFGRDGVIARRLAANLAPLPPEKTSVKLFDLPDTDCASVGSILLNDVLSCSGGSAPPDCLGAVSVSSRAAIPFDR
jgi:hypothetical protein